MRRLPLLALLALVASNLLSCGGDGGGTGPVTGTIRGTVTASGDGLRVTVSLSGADSRSATTAASGSYSFSGLPTGSYTVEISGVPDDAVFDVTSRTTSLEAGETVTLDFEGSFLRGAVAGTVTTDLGAAEGVAVRAAGTETVEARTDAAGEFRLEARAGEYTVSLVDVDPLHYDFPDAQRGVSVSVDETTSVAFQGTDLWGPCALGRLTPGEERSGSLEEGDCTTGEGGHRDVHVFYGAPGGTVEVDVSSGDFDASVLLRGPDGEVVARGGEPGDPPDARLTHTFQETNRFWIEVSATEPAGAGAYTLSVSGQGFRPEGVWSALAAGWYHTCGVAADGGAWCWGRNRSGQLGNGEPSQPPQEGIFRVTPARVGGELTAVGVAAGASSTCAVDDAGVARCWGSNNRGELGIGASSAGDFRTIPEPVAGGIAFGQVTVGADHACGLAADGAVYCWGGDGEGQLGTRSGGADAPERVDSDQVFTHVTAGWFYTCALAEEGVGFCWGANSSGELGIDDDVVNELSPQPVAGNLRFRALDAGFAHTCGVTTDGDAYCWGANESGQLGVGSSSANEIRRAPSRVRGGLTLEAISVGGFHTCALTSSGEAWCWGSGTQGQLGRGELGGTVAEEPVPVAGARTFRSIHAGLSHTCGVTTDGDAYCWGANSEESSGALGIGTTGNQGSPQLVEDPAGGGSG